MLSAIQTFKSKHQAASEANAPVQQSVPTEPHPTQAQPMTKDCDISSLVAALTAVGSRGMLSGGVFRLPGGDE